jgi:TAG lipase/lysophosphatidylethanolamine acyltransferase
VCSALEYICDTDWGTDFSIQEKFEFFFETRQAFGRSALLLSGGATLGMYHLGVVKVLAENQLLPRVISGSSVGSIIASVVAVRTDEELLKVFTLDDITFDAFETKGSMQRKIWRLLSRGVLMARQSTRFQIQRAGC